MPKQAKKRKPDKATRKRKPTSSFRAHFDGKSLVPDEPVHLPVDQPLQVLVAAFETSERETPLQRLAKLAYQYPVNPDLPTDGAEQHDHYLYGTPKR